MKIKSLRTYPLSVPVGDLQRTSQGSFGTISIVVVVVETDTGLTGVGEGLARFGPKAYAELIDGLLAPKIVGMDPFAVEAIWQKLFRTFSGRSGGMLIEALSAIDIAIWDIMGKEVGRPVYELLGHMGRNGIRAYASSIPWVDDEGARKTVLDCVAAGFKEIKVKIGAPGRGGARARQTRSRNGRAGHSAHGQFELDLRCRRRARGRQGSRRAWLFLVRGADRAGGHRGLSLAATEVAAAAGGR